MIRAFVFGKFLPFHKGHEAMINFALQYCDQLSIMICCSDYESINGDIRKQWISASFLDDTIKIDIYNYNENDLPNTSVSDPNVAATWSAVFKKYYYDYDIVVTSEKYGDYVAENLKIKHLLYDKNRFHFPISATTLRTDLWSNWHFLPDSVKSFFAIKIVLLGTESTGKTTLAKLLANHFNGSLVAETAREIIENSNDFSINDLYKVIEEHTLQIEKAMIGKSPLIVIDTNIHITQSYCIYFFNESLIVSDRVKNIHKPNLYLYLKNDAPYIQDGTRLNEAERNNLDLSHRSILADNHIDFVEISGNWEQRFLSARAVIEQFIKKHKEIVWHENSQFVSNS